MQEKPSQLSQKELIQKLKTLVASERECVASQIRYLKEVFERKLYLQMGYFSLPAFCQEVLSMTENQSWKRCQVVRLICIHPEFLEMIRSGEAKLSYVALAANKITEANKDKIKEALKGKNRKSFEEFLSRVTPNGNVLDNSEEKVELKISLPKAVVEKLERARRLCSVGKGYVEFSTVIDEALNLYLDKKDPVKKAEKAEKKKSKTTSQGKAKVEKVNRRSRYIPQGIRNEVVLRAGGRCEYVSPDGKRCEERCHLEIDHFKPFCWEGEHSRENLRVLCANHNKLEAERVLGKSIGGFRRPGLVDSCQTVDRLWTAT